MKHIFLYLAIILGIFTNSLLAQQELLYKANWEQSDYSSFGPQGGIIEVLYETDSTGSFGLPDDFPLSFEFAPFSNQHFSFNDSVLTGANELMIGVNEAYSAFIEDTSQLTIESAPEFAGLKLEERILDQAGMCMLGAYEDPVTSQLIFCETCFTADDITENPPLSGLFKTFALTYSNLVPPEVPANQVPKANYTLFSDAIIYSIVLEPTTDGDIDEDGDVDDVDLNLLLSGFDSTPSLQNNVNLNALLGNFGRTDLPSGMTVPEPSCMLLLCLGGFGVLAFGRQRK